MHELSLTLSCSIILTSLQVTPGAQGTQHIRLGSHGSPSLASESDTSGSYTVHGPGQARAGLLLLALGPGPRGPGQTSWPVAPGQLNPGPRGSGQGRARASPGPEHLWPR